ncbi:MAG: hypothetical protein JSW45_02850 [Thiotrichales bacterium]|nr:MAG: hypothetical protein JSW45_02850 [Thiotrichales bacterium]
MRLSSGLSDMDYSFNAKTFRTLLHSAVADHISELTADSAGEQSPEQLLSAMEQAIDVMERADADAAVKQGETALSAAEVTEIGDFSLGLLEAIVGRVETASGHQNRELARLAIPLCLWVARRGGSISKLELAVNSLAAWANELQDTVQIAELARVIREIIDAASDEIRQDLEQSNPMRPWRIINLNYGIVATRSHDPVLMDEAFGALVENLPQDARAFFREGMQQMDIVGYPEEVREVVEKYDRMWGSGDTLH